MNTPTKGQNVFVIIVSKSNPTTAQQYVRAIGRIFNRAYRRAYALQHLHVWR
ncbi:MAG: hypothetical protein KDD03_02090 [Gelidibacter sp.]|nr:hypothetical protein [Gelidibacter sp.]